MSIEHAARHFAALHEISHSLERTGKFTRDGQLDTARTAISLLDHEGWNAVMNVHKTRINQQLRYARADLAGHARGRRRSHEKRLEFRGCGGKSGEWTPVCSDFSGLGVELRPLAGERLRPLGHLSVAAVDKEKGRHNQ